MDNAEAVSELFRPSLSRVSDYRLAHTSALDWTSLATQLGLTVTSEQLLDADGGIRYILADAAVCAIAASARLNTDQQPLTVFELLEEAERTIPLLTEWPEALSSADLLNFAAQHFSVMLTGAEQIRHYLQTGGSVTTDQAYILITYAAISLRLAAAHASFHEIEA